MFAIKCSFSVVHRKLLEFRKFLAVTGNRLHINDLLFLIFLFAVQPLAFPPSFPPGQDSASRLHHQSGHYDWLRGRDGHVLLVRQGADHQVPAQQGGLDDGGDHNALVRRALLRVLLHRHECPDQSQAHRLSAVRQIRYAKYGVGNR